MAKVKIAGIEIDTDAHKNNSKEHQAAIFAHLSYYKKQEAVKELQEAIKAPVVAKPTAEPPKQSIVEPPKQ